MRRSALLALAAICLALAVGLAWQWVTPQGTIKGVDWTPPQAIRPSIEGGLALPMTGVEVGQMVSALDRPLLVPSRRPPPPPQAASASIADTPPDVRVLATYGNETAGGMIAVWDGRIVRARLGETVNGWRVDGLKATGVELTRAGATRFFELARVVGNRADPKAAEVARGTAASGSYEAARQRERDEARAQVRRMNALRANVGLAPLPEP